MRYTSSMTSPQQVSVDEKALIQEARVLAVQFSRVLDASSIPEQEKAAWAALIPEMRLDQLSRFSTVLDAYLTKAVRDELRGVEEQLRAVMEKYAAKQAQTENTLMSGISRIVQEIRTEDSARARGE